MANSRTYTNSLGQTAKIKLVPVTDDRNTITRDGNMTIIEVNKNAETPAAKAERLRKIREASAKDMEHQWFKGTKGDRINTDGRMQKCHNW